VFPARKQNLGGHKFKDDSKAETVATPLLTTLGTNFYQQGRETLFLRYDKYLKSGNDHDGK
jgi:hypothetical protein